MPGRYLPHCLPPSCPDARYSVAAVAPVSPSSKSGIGCLCACFVLGALSEIILQSACCCGRVVVEGSKWHNPMMGLRLGARGLPTSFLVSTAGD